MAPDLSYDTKPLTGALLLRRTFYSRVGTKGEVMATNVSCYGRPSRFDLIYPVVAGGLLRCRPHTPPYSGVYWKGIPCARSSHSLPKFKRANMYIQPARRPLLLHTNEMDNPLSACCQVPVTLSRLSRYQTIDRKLAFARGPCPWGFCKRTDTKDEILATNVSRYICDGRPGRFDSLCAVVAGRSIR